MRQRVTVLEHLTTLALQAMAYAAGKISELASTTASAMLELKNEVTTAAKTAEADKVTFADGETFQAKYDAGELTGPPGAPGSNANVTGGASSIVTANLTAGRALVSDANGKVAVSDITSTVLAFLSGVTSNIQAQLNAKLPLAGGTLTGDVTMSGATRQIKYASGKRTAAPISFYAGDENGSGVVIGDGGRTIIGGGEAAQNLRGALGGSDTNEELHMASDGAVNVHTKCQTISQRHTFTFQADGRLSGVANPTATTDVANKQYVDAKQADIFYRAVSLTVAGWNASAKTQTVTVSGVVAAETSQLIIPTPALASRAAYQAAGIQATAQGANTVTFTAETVPTVALTVYVTVVPL